MPGVAVIVAVIDSGKILLTKREDFEVWCLPGGRVEEGESLAAAGIRETKEETGLAVELTRLVGVYSRLGGGLPDNHSVLYTAKPIGGELKVQSGETVDAAYFAFDDLPEELLFGHKKRIHDAISDASGVSVRQELVLADKTTYTRKELYALRDGSGMTRREFYLQRFGQAQISETVEVE